MPSCGHCSSPLKTGRIGEPAKKHPIISVPPEIDESWISDFTLEYTQSNCSSTNGEPVESIDSRLSNLQKIFGNI